ncbi:tetratricopeptide repeat protein [Schlesneria paludicola]|uniref:tetratricopeptide repeat protein n=1 Tax=Schlesneria paludicola TaxID=360056 RepID=UPI00029AA43C|nr:tetratricopeptide repeat protein [Schlesneria paludicola]
MRPAPQQRILLAVLCLVALVDRAAAQEAAAAPAEAATPGTSLSRGYSLQDADDVALPLNPVKPRSAATEQRMDALGWFMTGRMFDNRFPREASEAGAAPDGRVKQERQKALKAFRKAVKLEPDTIDLYRYLIPLEIEFKNLEAAVRYGEKVAQLDPDDWKIQQLLASNAAESGQLPDAIKHLEQAVNSPRMDKHSPQYVLLQKSLGVLYARTGQTEQAADAYEILFDVVKNPDKYGLDQRAQKVLLSDPLTGYEQIGQVLLEAKRLESALDAFERAAKASPRLGVGNLSYNRARVLFLSEKYDEALVELDKYFDAQKRSKGRLPYQLLAEILAKQNRSDELIRRLEAIAENDAQNVDLQYFLADRLTDVNELERARNLYDSMLRKGGDASGYAGLARVLRKMQKSDELLDALGRGFARGEDAIAMLEPEVKAISQDKALMEALVESGRKRAKSDELKFEEALLLAKFAAVMKEAESSGEFYRMAIALNREGRPTVLIQLEMAEMFLKLRKYPQAVEAFGEILNSGQLNDRGQAMTYSSMAQALAYDNRTDEALAAISKAIKLDDDEAQYRFYEAWIYGHAKRWDDAIQKFEQLIRDFPDEKRMILVTQFSLSNVYVQKGDVKTGEEILEKVLEDNPDNSQVNNDLGYLWADQGKNLDRAESMIRKALAVEPDNGAYLDSLGWVLFKLNRVEEAIPPLEQATQKSMGGDGTIWDHLGDVKLKAMHVDEAISAWTTALKHLEEEGTSDVQLIDKIKDKLKQHGGIQPKPADKDAP